MPGTNLSEKKEKYTRSICVLRHSVLPQALSMSLILFLRSSVTSQLSFTQDFSFRNLLETQDQSSNVYLIIYNSINNIIIKRRLYHEGVYPTIVLNCCCEIQWFDKVFWRLQNFDYLTITFFLLFRKQFERNSFTFSVIL